MGTKQRWSQIAIFLAVRGSLSNNQAGRLERRNRGWRTKCHTVDCTHNTFLLLKKHLTSGTELILIGWKTLPNESL